MLTRGTATLLSGLSRCALSASAHKPTERCLSADPEKPFASGTLARLSQLRWRRSRGGSVTSCFARLLAQLGKQLAAQTQQRLTGACAACSHCTATAWDLSGLDHSHAATPQRVTRAHVLWSCVLCFCLAPPAVDLLEALDRCVYETGSLLLFAYIALLLLLLSFFLGVGAPSLSLAGFMIKAKAVRRGSLSFSLFVVASAACVYETGLLLVCACRTFAASVEPLPRGPRAVAFPRSLHEFLAA